MKRLLLIILLLLCAVTVKADQPYPNVSFEEATVTEFTLVGVGQWVCDYNVVVNHTPPGETCSASSGSWAIVDTKFLTETMTWNSIGLLDAWPKSTACLWWYCYNHTEMPHGTDEIDVTTPNTLYLPFIIKR